MWRIGLSFRVLHVLTRCWFIRKNIRTKPLQIPPISRIRTIDDKRIEQQVKFIDKIVPLFTRFTGHYCFYRTITIAVLFRKQGIPLVVNMGARSVNSKERMKAHSWLTLDGKPFFEQPNSIDLYTHDMGFNADRSVRYWIGPDFDDSVLKDNRITRGNAAKMA